MVVKHCTLEEGQIPSLLSQVQNSRTCPPSDVTVSWPGHSLTTQISFSKTSPRPVFPKVCSVAHLPLKLPCGKKKSAGVVWLSSLLRGSHHRLGGILLVEKLVKMPSDVLPVSSLPPVSSLLCNAQGWPVILGKNVTVLCLSFLICKLRAVTEHRLMGWVFFTSLSL